MMSPEILKKILEQTKSRSAAKRRGGGDMEDSAKMQRASVMKLMDALHDKDPDKFLQAYGEFTTIMDDSEPEVEIEIG